MRQEEFGVGERRAKIIELLNREGRVRVVDLSKLFEISDVTIRSDLTELENAGVLERVHGGAIHTSKAYYNMPLHDRMKTNEEEKRRIALAVAALVSEGDTLMINSGTTTLFVVKELKSIRNLTIVTNSLTIAMEVGFCANIQVILLGGSFNPQYQFTYGDDAVHQLRKYKADKLILAVDGIAAGGGVTTYHHLEAEINRQMIGRANKTIVAADYSKVGRISFAHIDSLESIDLLVTNGNANAEELQMIQDAGVEIIRTE
jgi:DeoR/GlpR family transcriptional regulator of sugar metabolism